ncbi:hypothetical protein V8G54_025835 [Vigna mungo]|uniref:Uncharacterized protein n=1 Tax=Vigna mungo TaxID=3915 RepID=A0AAQ3MZW7_VIGMU
MDLGVCGKCISIKVCEEGTKVSADERNNLFIVVLEAKILEYDMQVGYIEVHRDADGDVDPLKVFGVEDGSEGMMEPKVIKNMSMRCLYDREEEMSSLADGAESPSETVDDYASLTLVNGTMG